jgi:integrase
MKRLTGLVYYKRHATTCPITRNRMTAAKRMLAFDCACPFWCRGRTPAGALVPRQSTGLTDLNEARKKGDRLCAENTRQNAAPAVDSHGHTVADSIKRFVLAQEDEWGESTKSATTMNLNRLNAYCKKQGVVYLREVNADLMLNFRTDVLAGMKPATKANIMGMFIGFLREAFLRGWITEAVAEKLKRGRRGHQQKEPFTKAEVTRLLDGAEALTGGFCNYRKNPHTIRLLFELMLQTGMRVGDAGLFDPAKLKRGIGTWRYTFTPQKQRKSEDKKRVTVYVPDDLKASVESCVWMSPSLPFTPAGKDSRHVPRFAYDMMQKIGEQCDIEDCRPHRLRDTFAVQMLLRGMLLEEVSRLLGHSSIKITEMYYAKWTNARQDRLEGRFIQAMQEPLDNTLGY